MWIVTVFSFLAGVNFSLMFLAVRGKLKEVLRSEELRIYVGIVAAATLLLCINLRVQAGVPFRDSITDAAFQTVTIITTTGFATVDFSLWPTFCRMALVMLMFTGACAGSTSGGIKISRVAILCKSLKRELKQLAHPHHVSVLKVDGQAVESGSSPPPARLSRHTCWCCWPVRWWSAGITMAFRSPSPRH